ncbi:MAG: rRNA maturation RNase YbeY [Bacteroidia bacterium]|nr:rRNA maturation RNase YbeY [Bacteroidia bacterium]NNM16913.1 rRNA maturation RNase YbeY [Bacteroidia bacterium]
MKSSIRFIFEDVSFFLPKRTILKQWLLDCIATEKKALEELNVVFCSDKFLLDVNRKFLEHDYYTDIITFQYNNKKEPISGEIFISYDRVKENADEFNVPRLVELNRVMAHGVAHLLGYSDKTKKQKEAMKTKEDYFLTLLPLK